MWTDEEYNAFNEFIHDLLYETMTDDDYEMIMRHLGAKNRGDRYTTICHNLDGGNYNLAFNRESRSFTCFSECGCSYSLLSLIKKRRELVGLPCSIYQSLKWLCDELGIALNFKEKVQQTNTNIYNWKLKLNKYIKKQEEDMENEVYDKSVLNYLENCIYEPWLEEGISIETQDKYNIKWYPRTQQVVIPINNIDGYFVGTHCRNTNPELVNSGFKYDHLRMLDGTEYKFKMGLELFGLNYNKVNIEKHKTVILLESPKSVMQIDSFNIPNISVGMFGMNFSKRQLKLLLLLGVDKFIIALDRQYITQDSEAFLKYQEKVNKIISTIQPYASEISIIYDKDENQLLDYKDSPTDKGEDVFINLLNNREVI